MTEQHPTFKKQALARLLRLARRPEQPADTPTLHERRLEGLEAAERLRSRPKPR